VRGELHLAACIHFSIAAMLPVVLYDHILHPSRNAHMWSLLVVQVGVMLFGYAPEADVVSLRLHVLVLGVCVLILYRQAQVHQRLTYIVAVTANVNSTVSFGVHALYASSAFVYYHVNVVVLFAAVLSMLYML
jgi:hypothetical protein